MLLCAAIVSDANGATWRVERDGSGDFTTIQPAVDGASPGDTIRIGPGRYTEHRPFSPSGIWSRETYVAITVDNLTIIGAARDSVIIGPDVANVQDSGPLGVVTSSLIAHVSVYSLTAINVYAGLLSNVDTRIEDCAFRNDEFGIMGYCSGGLVVARCVFDGNDSDGILTDSPTTLLEVVDSEFTNNTYGINAISTPQVTINNCDFHGGILAIQFERYSHGIISECRVLNAFSVGVAINTGAIADLSKNVIDGGQASVTCDGQASTTGTLNTFRGASYASLLLGHGFMTLSHCHILSGGRRLVQLEAFVDPPDVRIDLRNNYWGIANRDSIANLIWDGNDDSNIHAFVDFEPFSPTPLPTERKSLGSVKRLFR